LERTDFSGVLMDQLEEVMDDRPAPFEEEGDDSVAMASLGARLQTMFKEFEDARDTIEDEWLRDLRQYNAQYERDVLERLDPNRSRVYIGLTRTKVMSAYSRIVDLLFQRGERWFSFTPTPVAEIDPVKEAKIKQTALMEIMQVAGEAYPDLIAARRNELRKAIQKEINEDAAMAAAEMEIEVEDQMVEANVEQMLKETLMELVIFGSGCIKAGGTRVDRRKRYLKSEDGMHALMYEEVPKPDFESVSIFDCYPEPYSTSMEDCSAFFRRHRLSRKHFRELGDLPGFDTDSVDRIIRDNRKGTYYEKDHERERREMAGLNTVYGSEHRYEVLEFWGSLSGAELLEVGVGMSIDDFEELTEDELADMNDPVIVLEEDAEYAANVWIANGEVLMARISPIPDGKIPYHIAPYEKVPHQFWGIGVPRMMRDSQSTMNAAIRIFLDNQAISSGPMVEVNTDLLAAGEDPQDLHPWRIFLREGGDPGAPMVRFYQANTNNSGLGNIIELFRRFADETTSLPSYTHGQQTDSMNKTATGVSMLMNNANIALKSTIKNIDDYMLEPMMQSLYAWNMEWNDKEYVKGDFRVIARGSTALVQKEIQSQRLLQFMQIAGQAGPVASILNWREIIQDIARSMDIDPERALISQEEINAAMALAQGGAGGPVPPGAVPGPMGGPPPGAPPAA
jgi:hypothetical protein